MKIRIIGGGIFGAAGEIPVGTELTVSGDIPAGWVGRVTIVSNEPTPGSEPITNPDRDDLKKQADELGIEYAKNIPTEKLRELIDAKLAE